MNGATGKNYHYLESNIFGFNSYNSAPINSFGKQVRSSISNSSQLKTPKSNLTSQQDSAIKNQQQSFNPSATNKFLSNVNNVTLTMNPQERAINFGQDLNESHFKKNLRKPSVSNLIQANSYNIITNNPLQSHSSFNLGNGSSLNSLNSYTQMKYDAGSKGYNSSEKSDKVDDLFLSYKNPSMSKGAPFYQPSLNEEGGSETGLSSIKQPSSLLSTSNANSQPNKFSSNFGSKQPLFESKSNFYRSTKTNYNVGSLLKKTDYFKKDCNSVKEYAYKEEQNSRFRDHMEDFSVCIDSFMEDKNKGLFTLYDGHGGSEAVLYVKEKMPEILTRIINSSNESIEQILINSFHKVDEELKMMGMEHVGCTATVAFITREKDNSGTLRRVLYTANVGDSRSVLITQYGAKRMSYDHKATDLQEMKRVNSSGGIIFGGRVCGQLILSRALGDISLKNYGVISTPFVNKTYLTEKDKYLILASDGIWDVITDDDAYKYSNSISNAEEYTNLIVKNALLRGSQDNISCLVLKLN
jgi:protein phosphatase PTC1